MKGKNFSANNLGQRKKSDFYETPYSMTQQFLEAEGDRLTGSLLEPAAGDGAIVKVLSNAGYSVVSKDIANNQDFLEEIDKFNCIVTNPPFSLALQFIDKAKALSDYFAFLLPLSYLHGKKRYDTVYTDKEFPLSRIYVFTRYPMLGDPLREDGKYRTGMMVYAWFVWDSSSSNEHPEIRWLDNNPYILNKKDK